LRKEVIIKKLHLSIKDRNIAGVCGGLAETIGVDALLLRIAFVILAFVNGTGLILYLVMMIVLPKGEQGDKIPVKEVEEEMESNEAKKLYRVEKNKMIAGVCTGLERYFGLDVSLIRLILVAVTLFSGGIGIILYIVLWIILPVKD
jgi:phage shock protein PspC (stress-responsive transcriptional regulator)